MGLAGFQTGQGCCWPQWERAGLLRPVVFSGSWAQNTEFLQKPEGEMIVVRCRYKTDQRSKVKTWCRRTSANYCKLLVGRGRKEPRSSIQDYLKLDYFDVTMTELRVNDSGVYYCGIYENTEVYILRTIHLNVSKGELSPFLYMWLLAFHNHKVSELERPRSHILQPSPT
uniref:Ig-like domain-containing protein n=1 Tax=Spermophilus dauricus TaxID=99837 RepID=A0A8C9NZ13_SPEDA